MAKEKAVKRWINFHEVKYKFFLFVAMFFYVLLLFKVALSSFRADDPIPDVETIGFEMRKQFKEFSAKVRAGLYIKNFPKLDFNKNEFVVDAMLWFEFQKDQLRLSTLEKFSFDNGKILEKSSPKIKKI